MLNTPRAQPKRAVASAPLARSAPWKSKGLPNLSNTKNKTTVSHEEAFAEVISTGTGVAFFGYPINPGVGTVFPWLAAVASRYETYKFRQLEFSFRTNQPATNGGILAIGFETDCNDPAPTTLFQLEAYHDACSDVIWNHQKLRIDLPQDDKMPSRKTRVGLPAVNYDLSTYDVGTLYVGIEGVAANTIGRLVVKYTVDLFSHQTQDPIGGTVALSGGMSATALIGTTRTADVDALVPFTYPSSSGILFNQMFEGILVVKTVGTVLAADVAATVTGPAAGLCTSITSIGPMVNTAATAVITPFRVRAFPGTLITFAMTATTVTSGSLSVAACAYVQMT